MGVVFSPEAVAAHEVPEVGAHEKAARFVLARLFEFPENLADEERSSLLSAQHGIHSGMVYGSTAMGTAGIRSDLDLLINYHMYYAADAFSFLRETFHAAEATYHVPIEAQVLSLGALRNPTVHNIDALFAQHLLSVQAQNNPRWSYNWPADGLEHTIPVLEDRTLVHEIALRYASVKARQFAKAAIGFRGEADLHHFQRALELPSAIGRKVLVATIVEGEGMPDIADKYAMTKSVATKLELYSGYGRNEAANHHQLLANLDTEYSQLLADVMNGTITIETYQKWIDDYYLYACDLAYKVANAWSAIIARDLDTAEDDGKTTVLAKVSINDNDGY